MIRNWFLFVFLFCGFAICSYAQIDTEFWFAAPEVTEEHGDRPIFLRVTTFDKPSTVTVSIPANTSIQPVSKTIAANTTFTFSLTLWIDLLEHTEINQVVNKGLLVTATEDVSAYYEVMGRVFLGVVNPDIFALKGKNALGTEFYCPFQTSFDNHKFEGLATHTIDIVATDDNTVVQVTPVKNMIGHDANQVFTIRLNRGQSYSMKSPSRSRNDKLSGTHITSNKPIAITLKDDSIEEEGGGFDLVGDQLIPVDVIGNEYVVGEGWVYVLAIEEETEVQFGTRWSGFLDKQETKLFQVSKKEGVFLKATKPVYVFHVKNSHGEMGGAILPPVRCTGSKKVSFTRSTEEPFYLTLIVRKGGENSFLFNGNSREILAQEFLPVEGSNGEWLIYQMPSDFIAPQQVGVVENTQMKFHLGMENGDYAQTGGRYGYFSDFAEYALPYDSLEACLGDSLILDAGTGYDFYKWNTGSDDQSIIVSKSGFYSVEVKEEGDVCIGRDTVQVHFLDYPKAEVLPPLTELCYGSDDVILDAGTNDSLTYLWNSGQTESAIVVFETGTYILTISYKGCSVLDSSVVDYAPEPVIDLGEDTVLCKDGSWSRNLDWGFDVVEWSTGDTAHQIRFDKSGEYAVRIEAFAGNEFCGVDTDTITIKVWDVDVYNLVTPNDDGNNDVFFVKGLENGIWTLDVYNRWGSSVFFSDFYQNDWSPQKLSDGVYFYELHEQSPCNQYKGWVKVLR